MNAARAILAPSLDGVHLRDGRPEDADHVLSSMRTDFKKLWPYRSALDEPLLSKQLARLVPFLLSRSRLWVADVSGAMAAYAIIDKHENLVHWARTAVPYRRMGLCGALLSTLSPGWRYSHDNAHAATVATAHGGKFDPYALVFLEARHGL